MIFILHKHIHRHVKKYHRHYLGGFGIIGLVLMTMSLIASITQMFAATGGPNSPTTAVDNNAIGSITRTTPGNVTGSNNGYATASLDDFQTGHYIVATGFGFAIPTGATINGIFVEVEKKADTAGRIKDSYVRIVKNGSITGTNKALTSFRGTTDVYSGYGSSSDLRGETRTYSDINNAKFGVAFSARKSVNNGAAMVASVDHIRMTITYTPDTTPPTLTFTDDVATGPVQNDTITATRGDATVAKRMYTGGTSCPTTSGAYASANLSGVSMNQTGETNNGKYICLYGQDAVGNRTGKRSVNPIKIDITSPTFSGVTSGTVYTTGVRIYFSDNNTGATATLGGNPYISGTLITGNGTYIFVATDVAGNSTGATFSINIDTTPPTISFSDNIAVGPINYDVITASRGDATVRKREYNVTTGCSTNSGAYSNTDSNSMNQSTETNNGKYICLYAEDAMGNRTTLVSANRINIDAVIPTANSVTYDITGLTNHDVIATLSGFSETGVTVTSVGGYTHTFTNNDTFAFTFQDAAGNTGSTGAAVTWIDKTKPVITVIGPSIMSIQINTPYSESGANRTDNVDGAGTLTGPSAGSVNTAVLGIYILLYGYTDVAGNYGSGQRAVEVTGSTPVITLNGANPYFIEFGNTYSEYGATRTDTNDGSGIVSDIVVTVDTNTLGTGYTATYTKVNDSGVTGTAVRNVIVRDTTPPVITLNNPGTGYVEFGTNYTEDGATRTDIHDGNGTVSNIQGSVNTGVLGTYTLTYIKVDISGNTGSAQRNVVVQDTMSPSASVIYSTTAPTSGNVNATLTGYSEPITITNNGASNIYLFTVNNSFTFEFQDNVGHTGATIATVNNIDKDIPSAPTISTTDTLTKSSSIIITGSAENGSTVYIYSGSTIVGSTSSNGSFSVSISLAEGVNTLVAKAQDAAGNLSSASSPVIITRDSIAPATPSNIKLNNNVTINAAAQNNVTLIGSGAAAESGATIAYTISNGGTINGTAILGPSGSFVINGIDVSSLADGTLSVGVILTDAAGNVSGTGTTSVGKQTNPPTGGISIVEGTLANTTNIHVNLTASEACTYILSGAGMVGTLTGTVDASGTTVAATLAAGDGSKSISVIYTDIGANNSPVYTDSITLDQTNPAIIITSHTDNQQLTVASLLLQGTASDAHGVTLIQINAATGNGTTSWNSLVSLNGGTNTITVKATDGAGNSGTEIIHIIRLPITSNVSGFALSGTSAKILFSTNFVSLGYVSYKNGMVKNTQTGTMGTIHEIILNSLMSNSTYNYNVNGIIDGYNGPVSDTGIFITPKIITTYNVTGTTTTSGSAFIADASSTGAAFTTTGTLKIVSGQNILELNLSGLTISSVGRDKRLFAPEEKTGVAEFGETGIPSQTETTSGGTTTRVILETVDVGGNVGLSANAGNYFRVTFVVPSGSNGKILKIYRSEDGATWIANTPDATCTLNASLICSFLTDHLSYFATVGETTSTSSTAARDGSTALLTMDDCPAGDLSPSYYDKICDAHGSAAEVPTERLQAYDFGYKLGFTKSSTFSKYYRESFLTRYEMAKMVSIYATKTLNRKPDTSRTCTFKDIGTTRRYYTRLACQLGLMGIGDTSGTTMINFEPNLLVTRAHFGTVFSRLLYGSTYDKGGDLYYFDHLNALKENNIITNTDPELKEVKGFVELMLMRAANK